MNEAKKERKKVSQACENCRKRKTKCSGDKPKCEKCIQLNIECIYKIITRRRGPKIGYINDIMNKSIQKKLENLIMNNQISHQNIHKLAKNNYNIFNSSEILKKYINKDKQDIDIQNDMHNNVCNDIHTTNNSNEYINNTIQKLSTLKNNEYIIFRIPEEHVSSTGKAIIFNKYNFYNYNYIEIDYSLIQIYFRYAQFNVAILNKEIVMERIQNKTIFPGLLLAIYATAYMFKPNPDLKKTKELAELSHKYIIKYYYYPNIQVIQAFMLISNCILGTHLSWIIAGFAIKLSYILNLSEEDKSLSKKYNNERRSVFWYCYCKDIVYSIITGRRYRYDIINTEDITNLINNLKVTNDNVILVMNLVLAILMHVIKQYIGEINYNNPEKSFLENIIKHWFKFYDNVFNCECDIEKEKLENIIAFYQKNIFYCTLKVIFYRHQSTFLVVNSSKKLKAKSLNISEGIGYTFTKYELQEKKNYIMFFQHCLSFINRKNEIKENDNEEKSSFYKNNSQFRMDKETEGIPNIFSLKNFIYTKERKDRSFKIEFNLKPRKSKNIINHSKYNKRTEINNVNTDNENLKRSHDQAFLNNDDKYLDNKKSKIIKQISNINYEETHSNNNRLENLEKLFINNDDKNSIYNIEDIIKDNSDDDGNSDNNSNNGDDDDIIIKGNYQCSDKKDDRNDNDHDEEVIDRISNIKKYIDNKINENSDKNEQTDEIPIVMNPFDNSKPSYLIEAYFNIRKNNYSESQEENGVSKLKKCTEIADEITKNIKKIMHIVNQNRLVFSFALSWCFYEIGIIYLIVYVDEGKNEYLENAKYYRGLLIELSKAYLAVSPYLSKFNEMLQEAEDSVKNNTKKLVIKDIF